MKLMLKQYIVAILLGVITGVSVASSLSNMLVVSKTTVHGNYLSNSIDTAFDIYHNPFGYSQEYTDAESGMQYLRERYYNPMIKQFISRDTMNLFNLYAYVNGNPIMNVDPSGHNAIIRFFQRIGRWFKDLWNFRKNARIARSMPNSRLAYKIIKFEDVKDKAPIIMTRNFAIQTDEMQLGEDLIAKNILRIAYSEDTADNKQNFQKIVKEVLGPKDKDVFTINFKSLNASENRKLRDKILENHFTYDENNKYYNAQNYRVSTNIFCLFNRMGNGLFAKYPDKKGLIQSMLINDSAQIKYLRNNILHNLSNNLYLPDKINLGRINIEIKFPLL